MHAADIDWSRLFHAYGPASDTPAHLRALTGPDDDARTGALDHLWSAVIHQGTPWTVTPPAALVVAELLTDPETMRPANDVLRAILLDFLGEVAEAALPDTPEDEIRAVAYPASGEDEIGPALDAILAENEVDWDGDAVQAIMARVVLDLRAIAPTLLDHVTACLDDPDLRVRVDATGAAGTLALIPGVGADGLAARLEGTAARSGDHHERCAAMLTLGALGVAPRAFLADPHPAVRACAALAPALAADPAATREILAALRDPAEADSWLTIPLRLVPGRLRFALVAAAVERAESFEELLPAALAIAGMTSHWTVDVDWGPLLTAAFPAPVGEPPVLTPAQRAYLGALVANDEIWNPKMVNPISWFRAAGLPYEREACRRLIS
ncbi:hypothetical protein Aph01nite_42180 [Acrocarpospora phusangensis]|uniref:PBS lyase n=2 Tax=Acrocarpospora phusangensis TaxID=1070424 RepID=A0A919UQ04_9ACTN|nr:hypothetical protein Aph01nite_42180 [Acrocarpospora phusangensis]